MLEWSEIHPPDDNMSHSKENTLHFLEESTPRGKLQLNNTVMIRRASAVADLTEPISGKSSEKETLRGLNERLAGFIDMVHQLESKNYLLEREIVEMRGRTKSAFTLEQTFGHELDELRQLLRDVTHQRDQVEIEHRNLEEELSNLRGDHEEEVRRRSNAEHDIMVLKKDIGAAYEGKLQFEMKAQSLVEEIRILKTKHEAEVSHMLDRIRSAQVTVTAHDFGGSDVTAVLRDLRALLEGQALTDLEQVGNTLQSQFVKLIEETEAKRANLKATQEEIAEYKGRLLASNVELDYVRGTRESLVRKLRYIDGCHQEEITDYQNTIKTLENELENYKFNVSGYLKEYQSLFNVKMALDVEILSYRKLLGGEEARLSASSNNHISLSRIYHQSPVYTLHCHSSPGCPYRRAEPQYKFVEEIITETTREIEMLEFEEMDSEETEAGIDQPDFAHKNRGGKEEDMYSKNNTKEK